MIRMNVRMRVGAFDLGIKLSVGREITVLYGNSGAGKTLTLEVLAGLLTPCEGRVEVNGQLVFDRESGVNVRPHRRQVGYVVQNYALFPHLTVRQNISYGISHLGKDERRSRINGSAEMLGLQGLLDRRPSQISGGQAQRVALARALARRPPVLLLDEPFASVDSAVRGALRHELRRLARDLGLSVLMVTHDLTEAYNVGDRLAIIDDGCILQEGPRHEVFDRPTTRRTAELLGVNNIIPGRVVVGDHECMHVVTDLGKVVAASGAATFSPGDKVCLAIRAEQVFLEDPGRPIRHRDNHFAVTIVDEAAFGFSHTLFARVESASPGAPHLEIQIPAHPYQVLGVPARRDWRIRIPPDAVHVVMG